MDLPYKPFSLIILGRPFFVLTTTNIESKKYVISLQVRKQKLSFDFPNFKIKHCEKKDKLHEKKTIAELAAIYFNIHERELERSLINNDTIPDNKGKDELDVLMDSAPKIEGHVSTKYEELERKEDDEPPSPELKNLEENLRYVLLSLSKISLT
jgi:hypothetical protein